MNITNNNHFRHLSAFSKRSNENSLKRGDLHRIALKNSNSRTTLQVCPTDRSESQVNQTLNHLALVNEMQSPRLSEFHIKAFIRFRPQKNLIQSEGTESNGNKKIAIIDKRKILCQDNFFTYDQVFQPPTQQEEIYNCVCKQMVQHFVRGFNSTVFAYGQTGSGKTYTMFGQLNNQVKKGLIPSAIKDIFSSVKDICHESVDGINNQVIISCSMLEIYKETMIDLLSNEKSDLKIKENQFFNVSNLTIKQVANEQEMCSVLKIGNESKKMRETNMNEASSRSHVIFTIYLQVRKQHEKRLSKFNLVDLAGSQKVSKSKVEGEGLQEAKKINLSLSCLGNTINALLKRNDHIPYRQSKLTRLLFESIGGNSLTRLIVTCSSEDTEIQETLSSLKFASRAKNLKTNPLINTLRKSQKSVSRIAYENLKTNLNKAEYKITKIKSFLDDLKNSSSQNQFLSGTQNLNENKENQSFFSNISSKKSNCDRIKQTPNLNNQLEKYTSFAKKIENILYPSSNTIFKDFSQKPLKQKSNIFSETLSNPFLLIEDSNKKVSNQTSQCIQSLQNSNKTSNKKKIQIKVKNFNAEKQANEYWKIIKSQQKEIILLKKKIRSFQESISSSPQSMNQQINFSSVPSNAKLGGMICSREIQKSLQKESNKVFEQKEKLKKCRKLNVKISGKVLPVRQIFLTSPTNSTVFNKKIKLSGQRNNSSGRSKNKSIDNFNMNSPKQFTLTQQNDDKYKNSFQSQLKEISKKLDRKNEYEKFEKKILLRQLQLLFDKKNKSLPQDQGQNQYQIKEEKNKKVTLSETNQLLVSQIRYIQQLQNLLSHCLNKENTSNIQLVNYQLKQRFKETTLNLR